MNRVLALCFVCLVGVILNQINASNILVVVPIHTQSHVNIFVPIIEELSKEHNITVVTIIPIKNTNENVTQVILTNETTINMKSEMKMFLSAIINESFSIRPEFQFLFIIKAFVNSDYNWWKPHLKNPKLIDIMNSTESYDLMLLDAYLCEAYLSLNYKHKAPVILLAPSVPLPWTNVLMGNPNNYGFDPHFFFSAPYDDVFERTWRTVLGSFIYSYYNWFIVPTINKAQKEIYPWITESLDDLNKNIVLVFSNAHYAMGYGRSNVPGIIDIGGIHIKPPGPLPQKLDTFISSSKNKGFIYFSFGGSIRGDIIPKEIINSFLSAFRKIQYNVIWKMESNLENVPDNVLISPWLPQQDILGDSRIKVFITQGGMLSMQEAVYNGVPILAIPIMADQYSNTDFAVNSGYAIKLQFKYLSPTLILDALNELIDNPKYMTNARKISSVMKDMPMTSRDTAVWWTKYILRQKYNANLKSKLANQSWYSRLQLDVVIVFGILFMLLLFIILYTVKLFFVVCITIFRKVKLYKRKKTKKE